MKSTMKSLSQTVFTMSNDENMSVECLYNGLLERFIC